MKRAVVLFISVLIIVPRFVVVNSGIFNPIIQAEDKPVKFDFYPILEGEENGRVYVEDLLKKDTIKVGVAFNENIQIHSFEIDLYNKSTLVKNHKFKGGTAPNIFKEYSFAKQNEDTTDAGSLVTHFLLKVAIYDQGRIVNLPPRLIYFYME